MAFTLSSEDVMIEEFVDSKIIQEESKDAIDELAIEIPIEESNHVEESYAKTIQNIDISYRDFVSCEDKELTIFDVALEIKQLEDMLDRDDSCYALVVNKILGTSVDLEVTLKFELLKDYI